MIIYNEGFETFPLKKYIQSELVYINQIFHFDLSH